MFECFKGDGKFCRYREIIIPQLKARIIQLIKALKDHGRHWNDCQICLSPMAKVRSCSCGLDATINDDDNVHVVDDICELKKVNEGLVETVVDLRAALEEYGQHMVLCPQSLPPDDRPCDCGLDKEINA